MPGKGGQLQRGRRMHKPFLTVALSFSGRRNPRYFCAASNAVSHSRQRKLITPASEI
jgi:hypothetical protein